MSHAGVFTGSHRDDFGGNTFVKLGLLASPSRPKQRTTTQRIDDAMTEVSVGQYEKALQLIAEVEPSHCHDKRLIKIEALEGLGRKDELIELLDPPQGQDEAVKVISLLLDCGRFDDAEARLPAMSELIDQAVFGELAGIIATRRAIS